jgi:hypothetical protein
MRRPPAATSFSASTCRASAQPQTRVSQTRPSSSGRPPPPNHLMRPSRIATNSFLLPARVAHVRWAPISHGMSASGYLLRKAIPTGFPRRQYTLDGPTCATAGFTYLIPSHSCCPHRAETRQSSLVRVVVSQRGGAESRVELPRLHHNHPLSTTATPQPQPSSDHPALSPPRKRTSFYRPSCPFPLPWPMSPIQPALVDRSGTTLRGQ